MNWESQSSLEWTGGCNANTSLQNSSVDLSQLHPEGLLVNYESFVPRIFQNVSQLKKIFPLMNSVVPEICTAQFLISESKTYPS